MSSRSGKSRQSGPEDFWAGRCHDCGSSEHRKKSKDCPFEHQKQEISSLNRHITTLQQRNTTLEQSYTSLEQKYTALEERVDWEKGKASEYLKMATDAQGELGRTFGRLFNAEKKVKGKEQGEERGRHQ
ncbi:hypothetical protein N7528_004269 [Penicillium herquei]|nr:hypothetical protein N7528_004269 [Penicillium herquei]